MHCMNMPTTIATDADIHRACRSGDVQRIRLMLDKNPLLVNSTDDKVRESAVGLDTTLQSHHGKPL
jgi:hypothetical protein